MKKAPTESEVLAKPRCIGTAPGREPTGGETRRGKPPVIGLVIPCSPVIAGWLKTAAARPADSPAGAVERALEVLPSALGRNDPVVLVRNGPYPDRVLLGEIGIKIE